MVTAQRITKPSVDMDQIRATSAKLFNLKQELSDIFPEREILITQLIFALITREHVLIRGPFGTGKTELLKRLFNAITGAEKISVGLSKFMTESAVFGIPNPNLMREQGLVRIVREDGILNAQLLELDELLDASPPLLRTLLSVLNERTYKRGQHPEEAFLHVAVGSTNANIAYEIAREPVLGAVIDRFLFQCHVEYLKEDESRKRMYKGFLGGATTTTTIEFDEIVGFSEVVLEANQIIDPNFIDVYNQVLQAYRKAHDKEVISDRRACKLTQICEANALLSGRFEVLPEDIYAIKWALITSGQQSDIDAFDELAKPFIDKANELQTQDVDSVQVQLLKTIEMDIPPMPTLEPTSSELVDLRRVLNRIKTRLDDVKPQLESTRATKRNLVQKVDKMLDELLKRIDG